MVNGMTDRSFVVYAHIALSVDSTQHVGSCLGGDPPTFVKTPERRYSRVVKREGADPSNLNFLLLLSTSIKIQYPTR